MFLFRLMLYFSRVNVQNVKTEEKERHDISMDAHGFPKHVLFALYLWIIFLFQSRENTQYNMFVILHGNRYLLSHYLPVVFIAYFIKSLSAKGLPYWMQSGRGSHFAWPSRKCIPHKSGYTR